MRFPNERRTSDVVVVDNDDDDDMMEAQCCQFLAAHIASMFLRRLNVFSVLLRCLLGQYEAVSASDSLSPPIWHVRSSGLSN